MDRDAGSNTSIKFYNLATNIDKRLRQRNTKFLCSHPEIRAILRMILFETINRNPENIYKFIANLFHPEFSPLFFSQISQQMDLIKKQMEKSEWSAHDGIDLFSTKESNHSLLSQNSICDRAHSLLRFAMISPKP